MRTLTHTSRIVGLAAALALVPAVSFALDGVFTCNLSTDNNTGTGGGVFSHPITVQFIPVVDLGILEVGGLATTVPNNDPLDDFYGMGDGTYFALNLGPISLFSGHTDFFWLPGTPSPSDFAGFVFGDGLRAPLAAFGDVVTYCGNAGFCWQSDSRMVGSRTQ